MYKKLEFTTEIRIRGVLPVNEDLIKRIDLREHLNETSWIAVKTFGDNLIGHITDLKITHTYDRSWIEQGRNNP
jgi:hypothetical protein